MKANVLLDTIPIAPHKVGVRVYLDELLRAIPESERSTIRLLCTRSNVHLYENIDGYPITVVPWNTTTRVGRALTQQIAVPLVAVGWETDVVFEPVDHAALLTSVPIVTSVHSGPINLQHGQMDGFRHIYNSVLLPLSMQRSRRIIAISDFVKEAIVEQYSVDPQRIDVVHHGGGLVEQAERDGLEVPGIEERCGSILFVGSLHPHKNVDKLIQAYAALHERMADSPPLIIIGKNVGNQRQRLEQVVEEMGVAKYVTFEGCVSDERLLERLFSARLMVYPSSLEGFGFPAVEAMQSGTPLIASDEASIPEVVGEGGKLVSPEDTEAMAEAMKEVISSTEASRQLAAKGLQRGEKFSWKRTAQHTLRILEEVAES